MSKTAVTEKSLKVLEYLQENTDRDLTCAVISKELDMPKATVEGIITRGLGGTKGYAVREVGVITGEDGLPKKVSFIRLTPAGIDYDHTKAVAADAAAAVADAE